MIITFKQYQMVQYALGVLITESIDIVFQCLDTSGMGYVHFYFSGIYSVESIFIDTIQQHNEFIALTPITENGLHIIVQPGGGNLTDLRDYLIDQVTELLQQIKVDDDETNSI